MNKKLFSVTVLVVIAACVFAQQKNNGEFRISGQQVYNYDGKVFFDASVALGGTGIRLGNIKKGMLNITLPATAETGGEDKVYSWISISFPDEPGAGLNLLSIKEKDVVHLKFKKAEKKWVFISVKTGKEDSLENFYKAGYIWYAGQELPFLL
jgi:hypothetical protein